MVGAAKVALLEGALDRRVRGEILATLTFRHECRSDAHGSKGEGADPELLAWYAPGTLSQLRFLFALVERHPPAARTALRAVFSDVLYVCASTSGATTRSGLQRKHHWGWIADNVRPKVPVEHDAVDLFANRVAALADQRAGTGSVHVVRQDARRLAIRDASVDLIVTSPPYLGVIDYTHAHRLLHLWMGWPMADERAREIGARYRRFRRSALTEYLAEMEVVADEFARVLRPGAHCAVVIGSSRKFPSGAHDAMALLSRRLTPRWGPRPRMATRRRVSDRAATDTLEYVYVLERP